jgi:branched-chain amino acid transport system permease protein
MDGGQKITLIHRMGLPGPAATAAAAGAVLALWPLLGGSELHFRIMALACFYAILAISWNIHGLTGAISLGHAAYFGLGAYGSALASKFWNISTVLSIPIGGFAGAAFAVLLVFLFRRLRGAAFALATFASVQIPLAVIDNWDSLTSGSLGLGGIAGLPVVRIAGLGTLDPENNLRVQYFCLLSLLFVAGAIHSKSVNSRWGWAIRAVREDETAAEAMGVDVFRVRSAALLLSAWMTALCGALYAHLMGLIEPALVFSIHFSVLPLVLSIFGGRYVYYGPILGALILYPADQIIFHSLLPAGHAVFYGLVIILAILFFPKGIGEWVQDKIRSAWS